MLIDGSDSSVAGQAINVTTAIGLDESLRRVLLNATQSSPSKCVPKLLFNPDSRSPNFFLPGLTAILLLNVTTFLPHSRSCAKKSAARWSNCSSRRSDRWDCCSANCLPILASVSSNSCLILTFMRFAFSVPIHGSVLLLAFLSLPYIFVSLSLGILISSKANSQAEAMQLAFLTILPSIFFSGYIFPRETMPKFFYALSYFVPASYFINITRGIILRGAGIVHLWTGCARPLRYGQLSADRRRTSLPEQSHHGVTDPPLLYFALLSGILPSRRFPRSPCDLSDL